MTVEMVKEMVEKHNNSIDSFLITIPTLLGKKENELNMSDWFKVQAIIEEQGFYSKGMTILNECRANGWDVKMNMQSYKLVFYGGRI